jgi:hypothetical protein
MSAIINDARPTQELTELDLQGTEGDFLKLWKDEDAKEPSEDDSKEDKDPKKKPVDDDTESEDDDSPSEDDEESEEEDAEESDEEEDEKPKAKKTASDDDIVTVKVDGKEIAVPVKELKRLYGQEQSLTRKSEEVAATRRQVEETGKAYIAGMTKLLDNAKARFEPYSKIDWLVASKQLEANELTALRQEAEKAYADVKFLEQDMDTYLKAQEAEEHKALQTQARECIKVLTDPKDGIEGWNESLYNDIRAYAVTSGVPQTDINRLVDPTAFKILHKAMLYDKGKAVVTKKVEKTPKKIIKSSGNTESRETLTKPKDGVRSAMSKAQKSGALDAFADVFLAKWAKDED